MKNKITFVLALVFSLIFINGGLNKLFNYIPVPEDILPEMLNDFQAIKEIVWLMPLIAFAEIIGGFLIIIPKTRALGVLIIFPVMVGILLTHLLVDTSGLIMTFVIWAILIWFIYDNIDKYMPLIKK